MKRFKRISAALLAVLMTAACFAMLAVPSGATAVTTCPLGHESETGMPDALFTDGAAPVVSAANVKVAVSSGSLSANAASGATPKANAAQTFDIFMAGIPFLHLTIKATRKPN